MDLLKNKFIYVVVGIGIDNHTIFGLAVNVMKAHIINPADFCLRVARQYRHIDRFATAPPDGRKALRGDGNVIELNILNVATISQLNGKTAIAAIDRAT
jgi:hypothetical protein